MAFTAEPDVNFIPGLFCSHLTIRRCTVAAVNPAGSCFVNKRNLFLIFFSRVRNGSFGNLEPKLRQREILHCFGVLQNICSKIFAVPVERKIF